MFFVHGVKLPAVLSSVSVHGESLKKMVVPSEQAVQALRTVCFEPLILVAQTGLYWPLHWVKYLYWLSGHAVVVLPSASGVSYFVPGTGGGTKVIFWTVEKIWVVGAGAGAGAVNADGSGFLVSLLWQNPSVKPTTSLKLQAVHLLAKVVEVPLAKNPQTGL